MDTTLNEVIVQPTDLNNKIILYTELVTSHVDVYIDKLIANTAFGRCGNLYACYGNDFIYLLTHILNAYDEMQTQSNAGVTYGETEVYAAFGLESIRNYFSITHRIDIVPLYNIFGLIDSDCDADTLFGVPTTYIDLDCLILN